MYTPHFLCPFMDEGHFESKFWLLLQTCWCRYLFWIIMFQSLVVVRLLNHTVNLFLVFNEICTLFSAAAAVTFPPTMFKCSTFCTSSTSQHFGGDISLWFWLPFLWWLVMLLFFWFFLFVWVTKECPFAAYQTSYYKTSDENNTWNFFLTVELDTA